MKNFVLFVSCLIYTVTAESCNNPQISSSHFTTQDSTYLTNIAHITVFEVKCDGNNVIRNLYAEVDGNVAPVSIVDKNKFQVSWTDATTKSWAGEKVIRIYQEDEVSAVRKAQRSGQDTSSVPSLGSIVVNIPGAYNGPYIQGEFLAVIIATAATYFAITSKLQIVS